MTTGDRLLVAVGFGRPVEWLAIAGGAALGAFLCGLAAQLLCRATTGKRLPSFPLLTVRILGGVAAGVLTAMCLLSGGGNGLWPFGGPGGTGDHTGPTANSDQKHDTPTPAEVNHEPPATPPVKENTAPPTADNTMRVEVLTRPMWDQLHQSQDVKEGQFYRLLDGPDPKALHSLKEVEDAILTRRRKSPPLQHLFLIGPDRTAGWVAQLQHWAEEKGIQVDNLSG